MKNLTWQNPEQLFVAQELINKVKSKCCGIKDDKQQYNFPLDESEGEEVHSIEGKVFGQVSNPKWLINESYNWAQKYKFTSSSVAGYNFDDLTDNIYIFNKDTLITYNLYSGDVIYT